jgi:hypothetical protein
MNILELQRRAIPAPEPLYTGEWATLAFRPDIGSQQEFIVGVIAAIDQDTTPHIKWLPTLTKLSALYGDAITTNEANDLLHGSELAIKSSFRESLSSLDIGTPHIRLINCGYMATHNIDNELTTLLKRQAGAIWQEPQHRENSMDDDWAYSVMRGALDSVSAARNIFVPGRSITIAGKNLCIGLNTGTSYGNIISARYASFNTIERHIYSSMVQVNIAHKLDKRVAEPALFVILPNPTTATETITTRKTTELLAEIEGMGITQFCEAEPADLARKVELWASIG